MVSNDYRSIYTDFRKGSLWKVPQNLERASEFHETTILDYRGFSTKWPPEISKYKSIVIWKLLRFISLLTGIMIWDTFSPPTKKCTLGMDTVTHSSWIPVSCHSSTFMQLALYKKELLIPKYGLREHILRGRLCVLRLGECI